MKSNEKEISALLFLMDDPDTEVFETVAAKLLNYGKTIIPRLEQLWETTIDETVQQRIENLIHRALFQDLQKGFSKWAKDKNASLLEGVLWVMRYRYPNLDESLIKTEIQQIQKNVWIELNRYLSPLEQINVINSILYSYYKILGEENINKSPDLFFFNLLLEKKEGNAFTIGILYLIICEAMDIPIFAVDLPKQFVLAYFDNLYHFLSPDKNPVQSVQFFIDPVNGLVYTQNDVRAYLKRIGLEKAKDYPLNSHEIIFKMLQELANTYSMLQEEDKAADIRQLQKILEHNLPE